MTETYETIVNVRLMKTGFTRDKISAENAIHLGELEFKTELHEGQTVTIFGRDIETYQTQEVERIEHLNSPGNAPKVRAHLGREAWGNSQYVETVKAYQNLISERMEAQEQKVRREPESEVRKNLGGVRN